MSLLSALEALLQNAIADPSQEEAFFQEFLRSKVFAHVPLVDDSGRVRFIQFTRPDGQTVLPCFTSEQQSAAAAQGNVRTVQMTGRDLMSATVGAILMINPNEAGCTLYPEEVVELLATGRVARFETTETSESRQVVVGIASNPPGLALDKLTATYAGLPFVEMAYVVEMCPANRPLERTLVVIISVEPIYAERAARASITAVQPLLQDYPIPVDFTVLDPSKAPHAILNGLAPFYDRDWMARMAGAPGSVRTQ